MFLYKELNTSKSLLKTTFIHTQHETQHETKNKYLVFSEFILHPSQSLKSAFTRFKTILAFVLPTSNFFPFLNRPIITLLKGFFKLDIELFLSLDKPIQIQDIATLYETLYRF